VRNVARPSKPASLKRYAAKWRTDLLAARKAKKRDSKRLKRLVERYKSADVRDALYKMYGGLCCYCEAEIGVVAFEHIEHRKPKTRFPGSCFIWGNLHLACPKCNHAKAEKWVKRNPILDSVTDVPISQHLDYEFSEALGVICSAKTSRAQTTIDHAQLNRDKLCETRESVARGVLKLIRELNQAPNSPRVSQLRLELQKKTTGPFGSLVTWLQDNFLKAA
jgi:uncharacterized protein (TIGR02646 family)